MDKDLGVQFYGAGYLSACGHYAYKFLSIGDFGSFRLMMRQRDTSELIRLISKNEPVPIMHLAIFVRAPKDILDFIINCDNIGQTNQRTDSGEVPLHYATMPDKEGKPSYMHASYLLVNNANPDMSNFNDVDAIESMRNFKAPDHIVFKFEKLFKEFGYKSNGYPVDQSEVDIDVNKFKFTGVS